MYFKYDEKNGIKVPHPFNRVMTPMMTTDTTNDSIQDTVSAINEKISNKTALLL